MVKALEGTIKADGLQLEVETIAGLSWLEGLR